MNRSPRASETPPRRAGSVLNSCTVFGHCAFEARRETHRQQRMPRSGYPSWLALRRAFPESLPPTPATCSALRVPRSPRRSPVPPDNPQLGLFAAWTRTLGRRIYCADPSPETGAPLMAWGASGAPGRAAHPLVAVKGEVRWQTLPSTSGAVMRALAASFPLQRLFAVRLRRWWRPTRSARRVPGTNGPFG